MSSLVTLAILLVSLALAIAIGLALAYVPLRLLVGQMARNVTELIQRQRERRRVARTTPDRRRT